MRDMKVCANGPTHAVHQCNRCIRESYAAQMRAEQHGCASFTVVRAIEGLSKIRRDKSNGRKRLDIAIRISFFTDVSFDGVSQCVNASIGSDARRC